MAEYFSVCVEALTVLKNIVSFAVDVHRLRKHWKHFDDYAGHMITLIRISQTAFNEHAQAMMKPRGLLLTNEALQVYKASLRSKGHWTECPQMQALAADFSHDGLPLFLHLLRHAESTAAQIVHFLAGPVHKWNLIERWQPVRTFKAKFFIGEHWMKHEQEKIVSLDHQLMMMKDSFWNSTERIEAYNQVRDAAARVLRILQTRWAPDGRCQHLRHRVYLQVHSKMASSSMQAILSFEHNASQSTDRWLFLEMQKYSDELRDNTQAEAPTRLDAFSFREKHPRDQLEVVQDLDRMFYWTSSLEKKKKKDKGPQKQPEAFSESSARPQSSNSGTTPQLDGDTLAVCNFLDSTMTQDCQLCLLDEARQQTLTCRWNSEQVVEPTTFDWQNLDSDLVPTRLTIMKTSKLELLENLACAFLYLGDTWWLFEADRLRNFRVRASDVHADYFHLEPYLLQPITKAPPRSPRVGLGPAQAHQAIEDFGILLVEICCGYGIRKHDFFTRSVGNGKAADIVLEISTAHHVLREEISKEFCYKIYQAIHWCLRIGPDDRPDLATDEFRLKILDNVVMPIKDAVIENTYDYGEAPRRKLVDLDEVHVRG